jgi:hypothetical protein
MITSKGPRASRKDCSTALMRPFGIQARCRLRVDMRRAHDVGKGSFEPIPDDGHRLLTAGSGQSRTLPAMTAWRQIADFG